MSELGISRRTFFRDLKLLEQAGIPYFHEPSRGYRIRQNFFLPPINLTVSETLSLMLLTKTVAAKRPQGVSSGALSAIWKLTSTIPEPIRAACVDMMKPVSIAVGVQDYSQKEDELFPLLQCYIDEHRVCEIAYQGPRDKEPLNFCFEPYALHFSQRAWYAFGKTDLHKEVRLLKLSRMKSLKALSRRFTQPKFKAKEQLGQAWQLIPEGQVYHIELIFSPMVARNVAEVKWHATQQQTFLEDGRCRVSFSIDGLREIAWWICGYADQVEIVKPLALRKKVREMLKKAVENHR